MDIPSELSRAASIQDNSAKLSKYSEIISTVFGSTDISQYKQLVDLLLSADIPILQSREIFSVLACSIVSLNNDLIIEIAPYVLNVFANKGVSYDEDETKIREELADAYKAKGDFKKACLVLSAINLESASRNLSNDKKAEILLKITEFYLENGDEVTAESFNSKASNFVDDCNDVAYRLRNRVCHARILDYKGEFLQAARAYYSLSSETTLGIVESDLLNLLERSITSCILAKASPQRSMMLATIYKDERSKPLTNFDMLQKMFMQRIIRKPDTEKFSKLLQEYQKYKLNSGFSVLENAILEHNIVAISKIYNNIKFNDLAELLEIPVAEAEVLIATMVQEKRFEATLDQLSGVVEFEKIDAGLTVWEGQVELLCQSVEKLVEDIGKKYPETGW